MGEYAAYVLYQKKGADDRLRRAAGRAAGDAAAGRRGEPAPHPEAAKLFVDWAMSLRGQKFYQDNLNLIYASVRDDAPPMLTGVRLRDFKLLAPTDLADYLASHDEFNKEWSAMLGL